MTRFFATWTCGHTHLPVEENMLRRLAHARPIRILFWLFVLVGMLAMPGGGVPAPALAQGPDAAVVVIQADQRHLRPDISSTTFGEEVAIGGAITCWRREPPWLRQLAIIAGM